jgi:hypothetical protein
MRFRSFKTDIDTEISIVTLGSVCLLIATFIKASYASYGNSLFILSGFCLVLSGAILIYRKTVIAGDLLPVAEKEERGEKLGFADYHEIGRFGIANIVANTLFDIGIMFLILGATVVLCVELINSFCIKEFSPYLVVLIIFLIIYVLVWNFLNRRSF